MTEVAIRPARPDDAPGILPLLNALNAITGNDPVKKSSDTLSAMLGEDRVFGAVADHRGELVGYVLGHDCVTMEHLEPGAYLHDLIVASDYQRQGIGRQLIDRFSAIAKARGATHLWWLGLETNLRARDAYRAILKGGSTDPEGEQMRAYALTRGDFDAAAARGAGSRDYSTV
ncbi:MAG: GNAT family N-acetyltransferase [Pseudomonadota bacterium]